MELRGVAGRHACLVWGPADGGDLLSMRRRVACGPGRLFTCIYSVLHILPGHNLGTCSQYIDISNVTLHQAWSLYADTSLKPRFENQSIMTARKGQSSSSFFDYY